MAFLYYFLSKMKRALHVTESASEMLLSTQVLLYSFLFRCLSFRSPKKKEAAFDVTPLMKSR